MDNSFIKGVIKQNKKKLLVTYLLVLIEKIGELSIPFFLGLSIDGLINKNYMPLFYLSSVYALWVIIGTIRHKYDTKTYTEIYNKIVIDLIEKDKEHDSISKISAYTNLIREVVEFMEFDLVYIATAFINIIGSLVMIWLYSFNVAILCIVLILPVIFLTKKYGTLMKTLSFKRNSELEKQIDVISSGNIKEAKSHFNILRIIQIKISNEEATNYWQLQIISMILLITSLLIISAHGSVMAGVLVAMWSYLLAFLNGLEIIPYAVQKWSNLKDIISRIN
jgi:ABC-type multidrug transport system fused ATPase/permease subunit